MITETPAVIETESAPVVEAVEETSLQERLNSATEDEYRKWETTGEFPAIKPKSEAPPTKEEAPAASKEPSAAEAGEKNPPVKVETAATTEVATPQKKRNGDSRILQLLEENKRDREAAAARIAELEARLPKPAEPDVKAAPSAPTGKRPKPQAADLDAAGKPKYKTMEEVWDAREVWNEENRKEADQQRVQAEQEQLLERELTTRLKPAAEKHADFVEVTTNPNLIIPKGSAVDLFLRNSDDPGELLYHLAKNPQILESFYNYDFKTHEWGNKVNPIRQVKELTALESSLTAAPAPPKPSAPTKTLPPPPTVLSSHGAPSGDPVDEAVKKKSYADYEKAANDAERKARRR